MKSSFRKKEKRCMSREASYLNYTQILLNEIQDDEITWI